ncbi:MAG: pyridoxal-phosphate dependent enzyme [Marinisporobacter sp.]|jgi:threonine synthase|nr:pyridoxal-phosphate dependent enzyme [Marinisporobacter sp.]
MPKIITVQANGCAPIYKAFHEGKRVVDEITNTGTLAEGMAISAPKRGKQILQAIKDTNGEIITAPEDKIVKTRKTLAKKGFYVEPTTATTFAGFFDYAKANNLKDKKIILPLCGAGLKAD